MKTNMLRWYVIARLFILEWMSSLDFNFDDIFHSTHPFNFVVHHILDICSLCQDYGRETPNARKALEFRHYQEIARKTEGIGQFKIEKYYEQGEGLTSWKRSHRPSPNELIVDLSLLIIFGGLILIISWSFFLFHNLKAYFKPTDDTSFFNFLIYSFDSRLVYFLSILSIILLILTTTIVGILLGIKLLNKSLQLRKPLMISIAALSCMEAINSLILRYTYINKSLIIALQKRL